MGFSGITARKKQALGLAVGGLAGLSLGGMAHASDAAMATAAEAERDAPGAVSGVDVEGRRRPMDVKATAEPLNMPQTTTVISRGTIAAQNLLSLRDILSTVPGITFGAGEGGGGFGDSITLRGYSANTDITVDGVRDSAQYSRSDTFNIEQLEVTNGANSVYSGAGSVGGTINIVNKRPMGRDTTEASASVGTDDYFRATVDTNQRVNGSVAVRLNAMVHRNNAPGRDVERFKRWGFAPSIAVGLHGPTQFTALYFHQHDNNTPAYGVPYYNGGPVPGVDPSNYYGYANIDRQKTTVDMWTGIIDHDFGGGLKVRNLTRYQEVEQDLTVNPPQAAAGGICLTSNLAPVGPTQTLANGQLVTADPTGYTACLAGLAPGFYAPSGPRGTARYSDNTLLYNQTDFSWDGELGGLRHTMTVGFSFTSEDYRLKNGNVQRGANGSTPALPPMNLANPDNTYAGPVNFIQAGANYGEKKSQAAYLFDNVEVSPRWSVNFGVRYEHNKGLNRVDAYNLNVGPTLSQVTPGVAATNSDNLFSYRAGLVFKPVPEATLYVAYGNSRTPSQATVSGACTPVASATAGATCNVKPESARNYEVGAKWDVDGRLLLTAALFRNERNNYRVATNDGALAFQVLDGASRVDGIALGASGLITNQWAVFANYTYLKSELLQAVGDGERAAGRDVAAGDPLVQVPDHAFSLFTTYDLPDHGLQLGYGVSYQGETYLTQHTLITAGTAFARSTLPLVKSDSYMTHRIVVTWTPVERVSVQLNVSNVFDREYYIRIRNNGWATPGERRHATLALNYRF